VAFSFGEGLLGPGAGHPDADDLVLELPVLATRDGLVEEVLVGAGRLLEAGVEGAGGPAGRRPFTLEGGTQPPSSWGLRFIPRQPQVHAA